MNTPQQARHSLHYRLIQKLDPSRFPRMSGVMAALVGFVLDTAFVEPRIAEIFVSQDGVVLARPEGEPGASHFLGNYVDVLRNWLSLIAAAGLSQRELIEAQCLFAAKVGFFGPTSA
jgi:hypothetical protein